MLMTPELLTRFFESVGVKPQCPVCATTDWTIPKNTELEGTGVLLTRLDGHDLGKLGSSLIYVYVVCNKCGFIRTHARTPIVRWHKAQGGANA